MNRNYFGYLIIALALLAEVPRFAVINWRIEGITTEPGYLVGLSVGLGMGLVMPLGTGFVFHVWRGTRRDSRAWHILLVFFAGFLIAEAIMLTPYVAAGIAGQKIAEVLSESWMRLIWSLMTALSPLAVVAGVAYALDINPMRTSRGEIEKKFERTLQVTDGFRKECPWCSRNNFANPQAWGGHVGNCPQRPDKRKIQEKATKI